MASYLVTGAGTVTFSNDNLTAGVSTASAAISNTTKSSGKWCFELSDTASGYILIGICSQNVSFSDVAYKTAKSILFWSGYGQQFPNGDSGSGIAWNDGGTTSNGKVLIAVDIDSKTMKYKIDNGNWSSARTWSFETPIKVVITGATGTRNATVNFGATPFCSSMPDGYTAWDTDPVSGSYYRQIL